MHTYAEVSLTLIPYLTNTTYLIDRSEVEIMRGANHPSIVTLISFSESKEYYFLGLERIHRSLASSKQHLIFGFQS